MLATANVHKVHEMRDVLAQLGLEVLDRPDDIPDVDETEESLEGNALLKAHAISSATGLPAIADDTGLFVDALDGRPGVRSARYAGEEATYEQNVQQLLTEMERVPDAERTARFRTVIAVVDADGSSFWVDGTLEGVITRAPRGSNGFGYDPVFEPIGEGGDTLAQLSAQRKNDISHRGRALRSLGGKLRSQ